MRGVVTPVDDASFRHQVLGSPEPVLVLFWKYGCAPCERFKPVMRRFAQSRPELMVRAYEIQPEVHGQIWKRLGIAATPTVVLFADGMEQGRLVGSETTFRQLHDLIDSAMGIDDTELSH